MPSCFLSPNVSANFDLSRGPVTGTLPLRWAKISSVTWSIFSPLLIHSSELITVSWVTALLRVKAVRWLSHGCSSHSSADPAEVQMNGRSQMKQEQWHQTEGRRRWVWWTSEPLHQRHNTKTSRTSFNTWLLFSPVTRESFKPSQNLLVLWIYVHAYIQAEHLSHRLWPSWTPVKSRKEGIWSPAHTELIWGPESLIFNTELICENWNISCLVGSWITWTCFSNFHLHVYSRTKATLHNSVFEISATSWNKLLVLSFKERDSEVWICSTSPQLWVSLPSNRQHWASVWARLPRKGWNFSPPSMT